MSDLDFLKDKFAGALLGTFVGDALGMPVEGYDSETIAYRYGEIRELLPGRLGRGTYTDDTEMMIGVVESLLRCSGFDGADLAAAFLENFQASRGYGSGTKKALLLFKTGVPWQEAGARVFQGGSYGNGAAMRVAPVGCLYYRRPDELRRVAADCSLVTHAHPLGREGAVLQAYAVGLAIKTDPKAEFNSVKFLVELESYLDPEVPEFKKKLERIRYLLDKTPLRSEVISELGNDSRAQASVPAALYAFLLHPDSFEEAVVYAVSLGGDTDTIGAMTGAISGAYHGYKAIPERWYQALEQGPKGRDYIKNLADQLYELYHVIEE